MRIAGAKACRGFSVAELIISILVISIILAAFTPLITQKARNSLTVRTNVTKGLEIYTNPGTYAFDVPLGINTLFIQGAGGGGGGAGATSAEKEVSITTSTNWIVPSGVSQVTFTIQGAGGGGGGANGNSTGNTHCPYPSEEFLAIRGTEDESDLCYMRSFKTIDGSDACVVNTTTLYPGDACTSSYCAWVYRNPTNGVVAYWGQDYQTSNGGLKSTGYSIFTRKAASMACTVHKATPCDYNAYIQGTMVNKNRYRLPSIDELNKVKKYREEWSFSQGAAGLNLCTRDFPNYNNNADKRVAYCTDAGNCLGIDLNGCTPFQVLGSDNSRFYFNSFSDIIVDDTVTNVSGVVKCVTPLKYYNGYSAAGGASGAILEKTINVLPKDVLEITIGNGGNGGAAKTKGSQGETTTIVHKRNNIELGTYYVKGGLGGNAATTTAYGTAYKNGTANNETTPTGTCYARNRNTTTGTFNGGNINCSKISKSGESGTSTQGGNGGTVDNTITIEKGDASSGGYLYIDSARTAFQRATDKEISLAKGQNATEYGFGGGGGYTPAWANSTNNFYQGGKGAQGKVTIKYNIGFPGGGGGSGSRIGGVNDDNNMYEIKYKVDEGSRIVFIVGTGGAGGDARKDGTNGTATIIGNNDIIFLAGEGGKTATETDITASQGGKGGNAGYIDQNGNTEIVLSGIKTKTPTSIEYTYTPTDGSFKGQNGKRGGVPATSDIQDGYSILGTIFEYGFSGGIGGSPFGVAENKLNSAITCGGGTLGTLGETTNINYLCTSGSGSGNTAKSHDPVNNEYGGSGGGGGGIIENSSQLGKGGNGSSGYLRVRWDVTQQH